MSFLNLLFAVCHEANSVEPNKNIHTEAYILFNFSSNLKPQWSKNKTFNKLILNQVPKQIYLYSAAAVTMVAF